MKVLCMCPIGIGNYLLSYPACKLLGGALPDAELHLLALRHSIVDLAQIDPLWSGIHAIDPTRDRRLAKQAGIIRRLADERFDASLSFFPSNNWQSNLLPFLSRAKSRFAFSYPLKRGASLSYLNTRLLAIDPEAHDVNQNIRLASFFSGVDLSVGALVFPLLFTGKESDDAGGFLKGLGGRECCIGVHPGSSAEHGMQAKRWDPLRFGELASRICATLQAQALIFGGNEEEPIKHITASIMREPNRIIAPQNLRMTAALLQRCSLLLCNDSGLMHMAACMGVPTVAIFGPTDDRRNGPIGGHNLVVRKAMAGFPLWTAAMVGVRSVDDHTDPAASLKALSVDEAWEKVEPWLAKLTTSLQ